MARLFGVHHGTALRDEVPHKRAQEPSVLEPFKPHIVVRLEALPALSAVRLLSELRPLGYSYSLSLLRRYVAQVRAPRSRKAYLRMEPDPAEQAQVDWGTHGDETLRSAIAHAVEAGRTRVAGVRMSLRQLGARSRVGERPRDGAAQPSGHGSLQQERPLARGQRDGAER